MARRLVLEQARIPYYAKPFKGKYVYIWSDQWRAYWRPGGSGYTDAEHIAGIFKFEEALRISGHCGPEKQIQYHYVSILRVAWVWLKKKLDKVIQ